MKDKVEELLARLPSFNRQTPKIITCSGMDKWCERKFSQNITTITKMLKTFKSVLSSWLSVVSFYPRYHLLKWSPAARIRYTD